MEDKTQVILDILKEHIESEYGYRCEVYTSCCPVCEVWMAYDRLTQTLDATGEYTWQQKVRDTPDDEYHDSDVV